MREGRLTRSQFLRLLAACGAGVGIAGLVPRTTPAEEPSGDLTLMQESIVIDGLLLPDRRLTWQRGAGEIKRLTGIDAAGWRIDHLDNLAGINALVDGFSDTVMRIDKIDDVAVARASGRLGLIYYAERDFKLSGSLEPLARWHAGGLRTLQIAAEGLNELGGGFDRDDVKLTPFGRRVVTELNRLGIAIDVSHCGKRTTLDVAARSSRPVFAHHGNAAALAPHERNKSDEELTAIAKTGGVAALSILGRYLRHAEGASGTFDEFIAQIDRQVERVGIDHVGLSSDALLDGEPTYSYDRTISTLNSLRRWFHVTDALSAKGYSDEALRKLLGLNFLRAYREALG